VLQHLIIAAHSDRAGGSLLSLRNCIERKSNEKRASRTQNPKIISPKKNQILRTRSASILKYAHASNIAIPET
jgi:hypothetical protein